MTHKYYKVGSTFYTNYEELYNTTNYKSIQETGSAVLSGQIRTPVTPS